MGKVQFLATKCQFHAHTKAETRAWRNPVVSGQPAPFSACALRPNWRNHLPVMGFIAFNGITKRFPGVLALDGGKIGEQGETAHVLQTPQAESTRAFLAHWKL